MKDSQFTIGELARLTGVSIETIRYYERIHLMPRPPRTGGGRRVFEASSLNTLNFIRRCRELGFSLDDVRALLVLRSAQSCCMDVKSIASRHLQTVRAKLLGLAEMEAILAGHAGAPRRQGSLQVLSQRLRPDGRLLSLQQHDS